MNRKLASLLWIKVCIVAAALFCLPVVAMAADTPVEDQIKSDAKAVGEFLDDTSITTSVKTRLMAEKGLDSLDISVKTVDGVVTLTGEVNTETQVTVAGKVAGTAYGVKKVDNQLTVKK